MSTREELYASGKRAAYKNQCDSVIVAPDHTGQNNYHNCSGSPGHTTRANNPDPLHGSGSGYEWDDAGNMVTDPYEVP